MISPARDPFRSQDPAPRSRGRAWWLVALALGAACGGEDWSPMSGPIPPPADLPAGVEAPANAHGESAALLGVGQFGGCSAAIIDTGGGPADPAYVLTAGHCIGLEYRQANEVYVGRPAPASTTFVANGFYDTSAAPIILPVAFLEYSTMHTRDVAVLRLQATVGEVRMRGITPFPLADAPPPVGAPIVMVGHPGLGPLLRSRGHRGDVRRLIEDEFHFTAIANDCPGVKPGSSGSPTFDEQGRIFGVMSTTSGTELPCSLDNPCDLDVPANPPTQVNYGPDMAGLRGCFPQGRFDLSAPECVLLRPPLPRATRGIDRYIGSTSAVAPLRWNVTLADEGLPFYRYKAGPAASTRCDLDAGYGEILPVASAPVIADLIPAAKGIYVLCVHGGTSATLTSFTSLDNTLTLVSEVGATGP